MTQPRIVRRNEPPAQQPQPFNVLSPLDWIGKEPPKRQWLVESFVPRRGSALITGPGGSGKSLLKQQLLSCAVLGIDWLGFKVEKVNSYGFFCEDDPEELHRRQADINRHYGCEMGDLGDLWLHSRVNHDNILMEFSKFNKRGTKTLTYNQMAKFIADHGVQLAFIDTAADTFGGSEIDRAETRGFINALRSLIYEVAGGVILSAHPSLSGMQSGSGLSGSTGWSNAVRIRYYLTYPKNEDGEEDRRTNDRILKVMKSNYSQGHEEIRLRWENGVFIRIDEPVRGSGTVYRIELDNTVEDALRRLITEGSRVSPDRFSPRAFAKVIQACSTCSKYTKPEIDGAKDRLLQAEKIVIVEGRKGYKFIRPADMRLPDEKGGPGEE